MQLIAVPGSSPSYPAPTCNRGSCGFFLCTSVHRIAIIFTSKIACLGACLLLCTVAYARTPTPTTPAPTTPDTHTRTRAEKDIALRFDTYSDGWITVLSPAALARVGLGKDARFSVETGVELDAVSGATPVLMADTITSATPFEDRRHAGHLTFSAKLAPVWTATTTGSMSIESDHRTYAASIASSAELFDRHATLSLFSGFFHEVAGRSDDPGFAQRTLGATATLGWAHLVARRTTLLFQLSGRLRECASKLGCQANPYRHVPAWIEEEKDHFIVIAPAERHPDQRLRAATAIRLAQYLRAGFGLHLRYRYYSDTWRISGHTARVAIAKELLHGKLVARIETRGTTQSAAAFYRDRYSFSGTLPSVPEYRSADRELSRIRAPIGGVRLEYRSSITDKVRWHANARLAQLRYRYLDHSELPTRHAWLVGLGAGLSL